MSNLKKKYHLDLIRKIDSREIKVGIIGIGYVGLPLALTFCQKGIKVVGFDIQKGLINSLNEGKSHINHIKSKEIKKEIESNNFIATNDFSLIKDLDVILICVPTPLTIKREPDLSFIKITIESIKRFLKKGQLLSLESTTYPGTTTEIVRPLIEKMNFEIGNDFFLTYSPEREDPGNKQFKTNRIPKIIGGETENCSDIGENLYEIIAPNVIKVSSTKAAEMTKLLENVYRAVNIGLINELKVLTDFLDLDFHEIIEAAASKPFGFNAFFPGPGVGGHCIPIDPIYLAWKAKEEFNLTLKFIKLAEEINSKMPEYLLNKLSEALEKRSKLIKGSNILILGISYKKNIDDSRESPSIEIIKKLIKKGANVSYNDPFFPTFLINEKIKISLKRLEITTHNLEKQDCVILLTDHDDFNYNFIKKYSKLIIDSRGKYKKSENILTA